MRNEQTIKAHKADFASLAEKYRLRMILMFGSAVRSRSHQKSDLDLAVLSETGDLPMSTYSDLLAKLQKIFSDREVDLALMNRADPLFLKKIVEDCLILYGQPRELLELKMYAFKRYVDHQKYFEMEERYVNEFIRRHVGAGNG